MYLWITKKYTYRFYLPLSQFAIIFINLVQTEGHRKQRLSLQLTLDGVQHSANLLRVVFHICNDSLGPLGLVDFRPYQGPYDLQ